MPWIPSDLRVLTYTSISPLNRRSPPLPLLSLASLVLAKSREYTKRRDRVPAKPPEAMLVANLAAGEASLGVANMALMVLEGKVQGLGGEVPQHVGEVSSPEGDNTLGGHHPLGAVKNTGVGLVQTTLLDHLVLVLDEQLDSLDGGGHSLGDTSGNTGQHEVLEEPKLLVTHLAFLISCRSESSNKSLGSSRYQRQ